MRHWEERLLEAGLEEVLGAARAPDGQHHRRRLRTVPPTARRRAGLLWLAAAVLAAASVSVTWSVFGTRAEPAAAIPVYVRAGELVCTGRGIVKLTAPSSTIVSFVENDVLQVPAEATLTHFTLGRSAALRAVPGTRLEVLAMKRIESRGAILVGTLTLGILTGAVSWSVLGNDSSATAGGRFDVDLARTPAALVEEVQKLRRENQELKRQAGVLAHETRRKTIASNQPSDPKENTAESSDTTPAPHTFRDERLDELLAVVDWEVVGTSAQRLLSIVDEVLKGLADNGELPMERFGEVQLENAKIVAQLKAILAASYERSGENGAFTQPAVAANVLLATLRAAGRKLSTDQVEGIERIVAFYKAKDLSHSRGDRPLLASLFEQSRDRRAFFAEVDRVLTPEQRGAITSDHIRGHDMDMFGGNFLLRPYSKRINVTDRADLGRQVAFNLEQSLGLRGTAAKQMTTVVDSWARGLPEDVMTPETSVEKVRAIGMLQGDRTHRAARRQVQLIGQILKSVELTPKQRQRLLDLRQLYVPVPR